jgi:CheY-like chemotaxis protein
LANLKKEFTNFSIPTVVLTANNVVEKREEYLNSGFIDCLGKPIEKTKLHNILVKYLNLTDDNHDTKEPEKENIEESSNIMDLTGKKILIVDDNMINLKVAENFVKLYNPIIDTVTSGKECLMRIKKEKYDLILLDDMMPQLSGIETMRLIKKNKSIDTPVIVLTANDIDGAKDNYLAAGFDDYLSKPIDKQKLKDILIKYIVNRSSKNNNVEIKDYHTTKFLQENGIFVKDGLEYLKTMDNYDKAVRDFLSNISAKVVALSQYKMSHNVADYASLVHDLRKECRNLGINKLVDMTFNHELKSKDGNVKFIDEHFDELLKEISNTVSVLKKYSK